MNNITYYSIGGCNNHEPHMAEHDPEELLVTWRLLVIRRFIKGRHHARLLNNTTQDLRYRSGS